MPEGGARAPDDQDKDAIIALCHASEEALGWFQMAGSGDGVRAAKERQQRALRHIEKQRGKQDQ